MVDEYTGIEAQNDTDFYSDAEVSSELTEEEIKSLEEASKYYNS